MKPNMFIEKVSKTDFENTVKNLEANVENKTWRILNIYDLQKVMKNNGKDVLPVKVYSICHPKHSGKILDKDAERIVASMMPCRVSVYEKSDGKTYISLMNTAMLATQIGGIIEEVMKESTKEVLEIIESL